MPEFAGRYYPASRAKRGNAPQLSLTIAITIEASRQATRMTSIAAQRRGIGRS
jgi:hypothetical protein